MTVIHVLRDVPRIIDGCGCHASPTKSGFALTAMMLLIGLFALLFSLRAARPTR